MYNEQLEKLIDMALADGELTEKEKQILFKKAESFGVDLDEFEMVLDAKLFQKQQSVKSDEPSVAAPKSDKFGDVKKCPACGAMVTSFSAKCGECGHEFSNIESNYSIERLFKLLTDIDNKPKPKFGVFQKDSEQEYEFDIVHKKTEIIKNFPVPNSKNDILEFLTSAVPYARKKQDGIWGSLISSKKFAGVSNLYKEQQIAKAWLYKCEQIIMKARFSMKDDKKGLEDIIAYAHELGIK